MPDINGDSVPGTVVLPTWVLVAAIVALFGSLGTMALAIWRLFLKVVLLTERVCLAVEKVEDGEP